MLQLIGRTANDYFAIMCANCDAPVEIEYLGFDPAVPHFQATCKKCNESAQLKLSGAHWRGLPSRPA